MTSTLPTYIIKGGISWEGNVTGQALTLAGGFQKMLNAQSDFASQNITPQYASSQITVIAGGLYTVSFGFSGQSSVSNTVTHTAVYVDDVATVIDSQRKISTSGDVGAWGLSGILLLTAGQVVDIRMSVDKNATITLDHGSLWLSL
jgi:hypothetical protein